MKHRIKLSRPPGDINRWLSSLAMTLLANAGGEGSDPLWSTNNSFITSSIGHLMPLTKTFRSTCILNRLNDEKTAQDYKVQGGSVLHLVLALRGGL
ncbi:hypothetical protein SFRURICE_020531 [Spodoptera frugiperda]|nr:hypothetical protein SFRURICE_020531 [Spodoptera frugiperda]